jgi:hypothetical protein
LIHVLLFVLLIQSFWFNGQVSIAEVWPQMSWPAWQEELKEVKKEDSISFKNF